MLNPDSQLVYDVLRSITGDDDVYKIIEADEVLERLPKDKQFSKVQLSSIVRDLKDRDYVNVKYFTPDEYCILTLKRFEEAEVVSQPAKRVEKKEKAERVPYETKTEKPVKPIKKGVVFLMAFLGGLLGSAIVAAVAIVLIKFAL
ncbi:MAG: hypothetical protein IK048_03970 [Clostridia bacterium]|nr:hypothetical protein [Clostridia bacterium]